MDHKTNELQPPRPPPSTGSKAANPLRPIRRSRPAAANPFHQKQAKPTRSSPRPSQPPASQESIVELRRRYGGWSEPPPPRFVDYPLIITKRDLKLDRRFHVMRFGAVAGKNERTSQDGTCSVDPSDPHQFTRPVTLHRRDPQLHSLGRHAKHQGDTLPGTAAAPQGPKQLEPADEEENARMEKAKAEREAQRQHDLAQIAPVAKDPNAVARKTKKNPKQEKVTAVYQRPDEAFQKASELHYEESLPWVLEDADGKNIWVGSYIGPLSETNAGLVIEGSSFRMIPLEKYYKFKSKPPFIPLTLDQAENVMNKKANVGRWAMLDQERDKEKTEMDKSRRELYGGGMIRSETKSFKNSTRAEKMDHDELDISDDEFQDDDEQPALERDNDEDSKAAQQKIRRDQLGANLFGKADEGEVDRQAQEEEESEEERKMLGRAVRKMLLKREKEAVYATDSDDDPFKTSSEEELEEEDASSKLDVDASSKGKVGGMHAKGSTTPSGKHKQGDNTKKSKSLKRPGSPNLSDASSNESSRKKAKKAVQSVKPSRSTTPMPSGSNLRAASSASDGEATAGEMSDSAAPPRKIKLPIGGLGTPRSSSRATSPNPPGLVERPLLTPAELLAGLPPLPGSIGIMELIKKYPGRVGDGPGKVSKSTFIKMVKEVASIGSDKLLRRKS